MKRSVEDLLLEWEDRRDQGSPVSPVKLCADSPDLLPELERRVRLLAVCDRYLHDDATRVGDGGPASNQTVSWQIGQYEVREKLGRGGAGDVFKAWDCHLHRYVAVKVLRADSSVAVVQLSREGQALAQLRHPDVVPIYEAKFGEGQPYFVMEYVAGGTLSSRRQEVEQGGPRAIARMIARIARAVQAAHDAGILHRDLKPSNILLTPAGEPRVADFGLAKWDDQPAAINPDTDTKPGGSASTALQTVPGFQPGTPAYMAPEQFDPRFGPVSPRTDVWAVGIMIRELVIGYRPFLGRTRDELRRQVCDEQSPIPTADVDKRMAGILAIADRCLARQPADRYPTMTALAAALDQYDRSFFWRTARKVALAAVLVTLGVVGVTWYLRPADPFDVQTARVERQLKAEGTAELIQPGGAEPAYRIRCGAASSELGMTPDGFRVRTTTICLVELLPHLPAGHWKIVAELQHTNNEFRPSEYAFVGLVIASVHVQNEDHTQHLFGGTWLHDFPRPNASPTAAIGWKRVPISQTGQLTPGSSAYRDQRKGLSAVTFDNPQPGAERPFRTVELEHTADGITARWEDAAGTLGPLSPVSDPYRSTLKVQVPNVPSDHWTAQPRLELVVSGGTCVVRRLDLSVGKDLLSNP